DVAEKDQLEALAEIVVRGRVGTHHVEAACLELLHQGLDDVHAEAALRGACYETVTPAGMVEVARAVRDHADVEHRAPGGERFDEGQQVDVQVDPAHRPEIAAD